MTPARRGRVFTGIKDRIVGLELGRIWEYLQKLKIGRKELSRELNDELDDLKNRIKKLENP